METFDQLASNQHHHSEMNALYSPTQPCLSAYCIWLLNGPGISPGSADQYVLGNLFMDLTNQ